MSNAPLMPKATAVWLVENTGLSFRQIADFCHLHELEVKGIAEGEVDPAYRLKLHESKVSIPTPKSRRGPRYTPVSRRQDRPDAIAWLLRNHPELADAQIMKLVGTTKSTIQSIRDRSHWNAQNIKPVDPVTLGLCTQLELDLAVQRAARKLRKGEPEPQARGATLLPASETVPKPETPPPASSPSSQRESEKQYDPDSVFAKLKGVKLDQDSD